MKNIATLIALVILSATIFANKGNKNPKADNNSTYSVTGIVMDESTGETLVGVAVKIGNQTVYTDFYGQFRLDNISNTEQTIETSYVAYEDKRVEIPLGETKDLKIVLKEK